MKVTRALAWALCFACTGPSNGGPDDPAATDAGASAGDRDAGPPRPLPEPGEPGCGLESAAFCDTFDVASPGGRAGDLDDAEWSVGRLSGLTNATQGDFEWWPPARSNACGSWREGIMPSNDFFFCEGGGRVVNAYDDGEGFTVQSMRPRRPFDFTGRTGVISFDVDGRSMVYLGHGIWWNVMITEDPEPVPYQDAGALLLFSRNGIGIELQGGYRCDDYTSAQNSISRVFAERDFEMTSNIVPEANCFATAEGVLNHVEIHLSQTSLEMFVSDAGAPETLRRILSLDEESAPNIFPLAFTRGYVHLQHSHYNAAKTELIPSYASYQWDNVAFDGPAFRTPRSYQVPDSAIVHRGGLNVGYHLDSEGTRHVLANVDPNGATRALLTMNTVGFHGGDTIRYRLNEGSWHDIPFDFPGDQGSGARVILVPVEMRELVPGDNALELRGTDSWPGIVAAQIELTLETE